MKTTRYRMSAPWLDMASVIEADSHGRVSHSRAGTTLQSLKEKGYRLEPLKSAMSEISAEGGRAGRGACKTRPREHYVEAGRRGGLKRSENAARRREEAARLSATAPMKPTDT